MTRGKPALPQSTSSWCTATAAEPVAVAPQPRAKAFQPVYKHWLQCLTELLPPASISRCLVADQPASETTLSPRALASFLMPQEDLYDEGGKGERDRSAVPAKDGAEERRAALEAVARLSVEASTGDDTPPSALAKATEEVVACEMGPMQRRKYACALAHLSAEGALRGDDTRSLARALVVLRRLCFHESAVCVDVRRKPPPPVKEADNAAAADPLVHPASNHGTAESKTDDGAVPMSVDADADGADVNASKVESSRGDEPMKVDPAAKADAKGPVEVETSGQAESKVDGGAVLDVVTARAYVGAGQAVRYGPGALSARLASPPALHLARGSEASAASDMDKMEVDASDETAQMAAEGEAGGSGKLRVLDALLARFAGRRVVVTVETEEEWLATHRHLAGAGVLHRVAGTASGGLSQAHPPASGTFASCFVLDAARRGVDGSLGEGLGWLQTQAHVHAFDHLPEGSGGAPSVLLVRNDVFRGVGALAPTRADAVVVLTDSWVAPVDVLASVRLRRLADGPGGAHLTVVRVATKGTLDEAVVRRGGVAALRGARISDLHGIENSDQKGTVAGGADSTADAGAVMLSAAPPLTQEQREAAKAAAKAEADAKVKAEAGVDPSPPRKGAKGPLVPPLAAPAAPAAPAAEVVDDEATAESRASVWRRELQGGMDVTEWGFGKSFMEDASGRFIGLAFESTAAPRRGPRAVARAVAGLGVDVDDTAAAQVARTPTPAAATAAAVGKRGQKPKHRSTAAAGQAHAAAERDGNQDALEGCFMAERAAAAAIAEALRGAPRGAPPSLVPSVSGVHLQMLYVLCRDWRGAALDSVEDEMAGRHKASTLARRGLVRSSSSQAILCADLSAAAAAAAPVPLAPFTAEGMPLGLFPPAISPPPNRGVGRPRLKDADLTRNPLRKDSFGEGAPVGMVVVPIAPFEGEVRLNHKTLSDLERLRLRRAGVGVSPSEQLFWSTVEPFTQLQLDKDVPVLSAPSQPKLGRPPLVTSASGPVVVAPPAISPAILSFRESHRELKRKGVSVDTHLYAHPLQSAMRADVVYLPSWAQQSAAASAQTQVRPPGRGNCQRIQALQQTFCASGDNSLSPGQGCDQGTCYG